MPPAIGSTFWWPPCVSSTKKPSSAGLQVDPDVVVAEAGVERRDGADAVAQVRGVDADRVVAGAGPDRDAVGERAGRRRAERDRRRGEAVDEDLGVGREVVRGALRVGDLLGDADVVAGSSRSRR